jgi:glycosyltransferase involved in cell wall biosynthesis
MELSQENERWLTDFRAKRGRPPRVLHIGNIANNAYKNARLLNEAGVDCDVICYDYYHLMGCPEWEDADFEGAVDDHFRPDWTRVDLRGYQRPTWFAQGPLADCIDYLTARRTGKQSQADRLWRKLQAANGTLALASLGPKKWISFLSAKLESAFGLVRRNVRILVHDDRVVVKVAQICELGRIGRIRSTSLRLALAASIMFAALVLRLLYLPFRLFARPQDDATQFDGAVAQLTERFALSFPARADKLSHAEFEMYRPAAADWRRLLSHYDLVQAYATDPIIPMLCGYRPYVAYEHGTLRDFTLCDSPVCRLTSLAYNQADHVFITNGDCAEYARKIFVSSYSPMVHPVEQERLAQVAGDYEGLHRELDADHLFLCPLRHDWKIKGTDVYIRALPGLQRALGPRFKVIMTQWGAELAASRALAEALGCARFIHWIDPLPRKKLVRMQKSVDIVFDQIALPHFGATAPEALACGVPVIMSYDPDSTLWIIPEPAPILAAWRPDEVVSQVKVALDPGWRSGFRVAAQRWIDTFHSSGRVVDLHLETYRRVLPA